MSQNPNQLDKAAIEAEFRRLKQDGVMETIPLRDRILATWQKDSPRMWANLQSQGLTEKMAFVVQARMWQRQDELMKAGLPMTDAREEAEREELLLEPETQEPDDSDLPTTLQDAPPYLKSQWREQMALLSDDAPTA
jgi:hypothetical protein